MLRADCVALAQRRASSLMSVPAGGVWCYNFGLLKNQMGGSAHFLFVTAITDREEWLRETLAGLGYELADLESSRGGLVRVFIDAPQGITVEDCARVSHHLTRVFAVEGVDYERLEVSSPGLDRPLKRLADFERFAGREASVQAEAAAWTGGGGSKGASAAWMRGRWRWKSKGNAWRWRSRTSTARGSFRTSEGLEEREVMKELLLLVDALSREKNVAKDTVFLALELALASATKKRFKDEVDVRVEIDRESGEYYAFRRWTVVPDEEHEEPAHQIAITDALAEDPEAKVGDIHEEPLEAETFGRIGAQAAKQVILQKIRDAEREQILNDFLERGESLVTGTVKRAERGNLIVESGRVEALLPRDQLIPKENLRVSDRVRAFIAEDRPPGPGPAADPFAHRTRVPGEALRARGAGDRGRAAGDQGGRPRPGPARQDRGEIQRPARRSRGHLRRHARLARAGRHAGARRRARGHHPLVARCRAVRDQCAGARRGELHRRGRGEARSMDVVVEEDQLALAIGKLGQNVRLASELTGWHLNIMTTEQRTAKSAEETSGLKALFMEKLDVDEEVAEILVQEGFTSLDEIAYVPLNEMLEIEAFDEETVNELRRRARDSLLTEEIRSEEKVEHAAEDLQSMEGMDNQTARVLASKGITTMDALADLDTEELTEMTGMEADRASQLIMTARAPWFKDSAQA